MVRRLPNWLVGHLSFVGREKSGIDPISSKDVPTAPLASWWRNTRTVNSATINHGIFRRIYI